MSKIDETKDSINNTRLYMSFIFTSIIALIAGLVGMYNVGNINAAFWIGSVCVFVGLICFVVFS